MEIRNVFYFKTISYIGGCESWFWYLSKKYKNMIIYYKEGHPDQIKRLAKNVEVRKYKENEIIKCDNFFCCYNPDILDNVEAKMYAHIIHCDYKAVSFRPIMNPKFNKYIAVSKLAGESFKELTGVDYELLYNPVAIDVPKVEKYNDGKLHLISATRLTKEKGLKRMQKLAKILDKSGIEYEWLVYTNRHREGIGRNVVYKEPKMDIIEDIAKADALVQLSDCESFCYSVVESLMVGTKVICTDLPVFKELGVEHGKNAVICSMDMTNVDVDLIKKDMKFTYKPPKSEWNKYLDNNSNYDPEEKRKVRLKKNIYLIQEGVHKTRGDIAEITNIRASELECKDLVECV
jgi:glycosyltransferase involved in cell wall biosynthesis